MEEDVARLEFALVIFRHAVSLREDVRALTMWIPTLGRSGTDASRGIHGETKTAAR